MEKEGKRLRKRGGSKADPSPVLLDRAWNEKVHRSRDQKETPAGRLRRKEGDLCPHLLLYPRGGGDGEGRGGPGRTEKKGGWEFGAGCIQGGRRNLGERDPNRLESLARFIRKNPDAQKGKKKRAASEEREREHNVGKDRRDYRMGRGSKKVDFSGKGGGL